MSLQRAAVMQDHQLNWARRNRANRASRETAAVGSLAKAALNSVTTRAPLWRRRLASVLEADGASEILEYTRAVDVRQGVLTFQVTEPALAYRLRVDWEQRLLALLEARLPGSGIHAVRFKAIRCR